MKKLFLMVAVTVMTAVGASAQERKVLWGGVELSVAPSIVDANYDYDEHDGDYFTKTTLGVSALGGFYVLPKFSLGAGAGISYADGLGILYAPLWGEAKYVSPLRRREGVDFFIYGRGGCPLLLGRNKGGGILAGAGWGFTFDGSRSVSAGYSLTHLDYRTKSGQSRNPSRHAFELKFGLLW